MVSVSCWFSGQCLVSGLWCRRVLSWSVCHGGSLVSLVSVCGVGESSRLCHVGSLVSVCRSCRGQCVMMVVW